ncbi:A12 protein [Finch poxvirus]|uniref:25 kDa core protein OPG138 n=2 Tax=unclassified Avipoxvirus TaxID=336487 RepID=A0AAT9UPV3_9POXV|nr:A12 protein [Finch poxvirus]UOX39155.1 A12 protein [Finch poxvirus]
MAGKRVTQQQQHSSFDEFVEAMHKIKPQLKTILSHIGTITANPPPNGQLPETYTSQNANLQNKEVISAGARKSRCSTVVKKPCNPRRRTTAMSSNEQEIQAVTNSGKIVYGVVKEDGRLEVKGHVGEIKEDLLGLDLDVVNAGRKTKTRRSRKKCTMMDNDKYMENNGML